MHAASGQACRRAREVRTGHVAARYCRGVRCLLMALSGPDLSVLLAVLADQAVDVDFTSDIAAGVALADADLDQFDFAVAVIPAGPGEDNVGLSAI